MRKYEGEHWPVTRTIPSQDDRTHRVNYSGMLGRLSLADLRAYLDERAPGIPDSDIMLNYATVVWVDDATPEELAVDAERIRKQQERQEAWERETYFRLAEKFGAQVNAQVNR